MSGFEVIVVVVGLLLGYWVVSALIANPDENKEKPCEKAPPGPEKDRR